MTQREVWTVRLWQAAPGVDFDLVRFLAAVLVREWRIDVLLLIGDALADAARESRAIGRPSQADELRLLAHVVWSQAVPAPVWPPQI